MIIFVLKITPLAHQRREALDILRYVEGPTAIQVGCLACNIYEGLNDDPTVLYMECWESLATLHRHIQSELYTKILAAMDISEKQPEIHFYEVSQMWGLDMVENLRHQKKPPIKKEIA
jgi:quinol monooxygenase YgiN